MLTLIRRHKEDIFFLLLALLIVLFAWRTPTTAPNKSMEASCNLFSDKNEQPVLIICPHKDKSLLAVDKKFSKTNKLSTKIKEAYPSLTTITEVPTGVFSDALSYWASSTQPTWLVHQDPWKNWNINGIPAYLPFVLLLLLLIWLFRRKLEREKRIRDLLEQERIAERKELAQLLHDGPLQELHFLGLEFQKFLLLQKAEQIEKVRFREMQERINTQIRNVCSILRPNLLKDLGLKASIEEYLEQMRQLHPHVQFDNQYTTAYHEPTKEKAAVLYGIICEAVQNALKHANPRFIEIDLDKNHLVIKNDGKAFTVPPDMMHFAQYNHFGMVGMFERSKRIGAKITINSTPSAGTHITLNY